MWTTSGAGYARHRDTGGEKTTAALVVEAVHEVRGPLIYATLILLVAAVPLI